jgi:hypothetical protein
MLASRQRVEFYFPLVLSGNCFQFKMLAVQNSEWQVLVTFFQDE